MSLTIALAGNPNSGKTTMFNKLTGANQRVGNWPGVTIDRKVGKIRGTDYELVDLPGIYSLSPYSPEEIVSRNFLIEDRPDAVINIVDATNLERNLFLTLQIIDTGIPTVIALNMMDQIRKLGDQIDVEKLSKELGCKVVPVSALNAEGIKELVAAVGEVAEAKQTPEPMYFDGDVEAAVSQAREALKGKVPDEALRFYAVKLVENDNAVCERFPEAKDRIAGVIRELEEKKDDELQSRKRRGTSAGRSPTGSTGSSPTGSGESPYSSGSSPWCSSASSDSPGATSRSSESVPGARTGSTTCSSASGSTPPSGSGARATAPSAP